MSFIDRFKETEDFKDFIQQLDDHRKDYLNSYKSKGTIISWAYANTMSLKMYGWNENVLRPFEEICKFQDELDSIAITFITVTDKLLG